MVQQFQFGLGDAAARIELKRVELNAKIAECNAASQRDADARRFRIDDAAPAPLAATGTDDDPIPF